MDSKFIARYRRAIREVAAGDASLELANKLERLGERLTYSLKKDIEKNPSSERPYLLLKEALRECLKIEADALVKTKAAIDGLSLSLQLSEHTYQHNSIRAIYCVIDDVIGNLLLLLLNNWQEVEPPENYRFQIDWNKSIPMMELVRNLKFTVPYTLMQSRLNAAKSATIKPAAGTLDKTSKPFTMEELALFCVYSRKLVTKVNAKDYLEAGLTSGIALYNKVTRYENQSNRTGFADETALVRKNMIARIQKVLPRLNDEQRKRAENDIHTIDAQNQ